MDDSGGSFGAILGDFGRSRRRGWTRAGRETLSALGRALEAVWGPRSIEVPRVLVLFLSNIEILSHLRSNNVDLFQNCQKLLIVLNLIDGADEIQNCK